MTKINFKRFLVFCVISGTLITHGLAQTISYDTLVYKASVSLNELYNLGPNDFSISANSDAISGTHIYLRIYTDFLMTNNSYSNVLLFEMTGTRGSLYFYQFSPTTYTNPSSLGIIGETYPVPWISNNIKSSSLAAYKYYLTNDWRMQTTHNANSIFYDFFGTIPVKIELILPENINIWNGNLPGIGTFYKNGEVDEGLRFDPQHLAHITDINEITNEWVKLKNIPLEDETPDLKIVSHRGFWGNNLGAGPIENTDPSIAAATNYTHLIESDITMTNDSVLIINHDYNLQRLSDYDGPDPDNTFIYDMNYSQLMGLHLRKRNYEVDQNYHFITLDTLISYMKKYQTVLTLDIKERARRHNPLDPSECTAACDVTHTDRERNWVGLVSKILEVTKDNDAWEYIAIKTTLTLNTIKQYLPVEQYDDLHKILFFPITQPGANKYEAVRFINDWYNNSSNSLVGFETNFKRKESLLDTLIVNGNLFDNVLHYVISKTELRPGVYAEEPMGPKGIVDRYAQWLFKDFTKDFRGDPYWLMSVPHFSSAIVTTDRIDTWTQIKNLYNPNSAQLAPANNFVASSLTKNLTENTTMTARYESGILTVYGLSKNDIGNNILLYDLQGRLIYQNKVTTEPQMVMSKNIRSGIYILRISGNKQKSVKLIVK
ncbi:glycerophosphodiester phosphodiesterase family protein [Viscerimonas tarda]